MPRMVSRTIAGMSAYAVVVTSPATCTWPVVISVSTATRLLRVLREQRVQDAVADLVSDLVRVTLGDRLGGEKTACHGAPYVRGTRWCDGGFESALSTQSRRADGDSPLIRSAVQHAYATAPERSRDPRSRPPTPPWSARQAPWRQPSAPRTVAALVVAAEGPAPSPPPTSLSTISPPACGELGSARWRRRRPWRSRPRTRPAPGQRACATPSSAAMSGLVTSSTARRPRRLGLLDLLGGVPRRPEIGRRGRHHHHIRPSAAARSASRSSLGGPDADHLRPRPDRAASHWPPPP